MQIMTRLTIITLTLMSMGCMASPEKPLPEQPWKLALDKGDIQVYTRQVQGADVVEFKGITHIQTSIDSILALIQDVEASPQWLSHCVESRILEQINEHETITLSLSDAPWPVKCRDVVVHNVMTIDPETSAITVRQSADPDYVAKQKDVVRVEHLRGLWQFTPKPEGQVEVLYQLLSDPAGDLPAWLVNKAVVSQPYETLRAMKTMVKQEKYRQTEASKFN